MTSSVSREAYAAAAENLSAYAADTPPATIATTGDEILAAADLLRREPRLRRALADSSRAADDRAGLLGAVFAGKVGDDALGLLTALVRGRWSAPSELLDAAERLGVDALMVSADRAGKLGDVEDELFRFGQVASGNPALASALSDSTADVARRATLAEELLAGKADPVTVRLVALALRGFGGRGFDSSLGRLVELAAQRRDLEVAYVTTAVALTDDEEARLAAKLGALYGRQISLKVDVDPSVIGGVKVRVGADLYDGTIARRLGEARQALVG
ncbi:ATP synthase subunit delta [Virgisporangium aliadipatigenens]|uniref:ATP synthase subunit delta n=1 Tax=Virgisporangium aliadipatigenens TaxID=741659 RepID=A0A8J3YS32_9ACTN|nr:F0F1 ATP synthase subunit delta [Virgisporangium aliadipatigenens]GIJ48845.1 ATP synthase subunit delta [Virgisporangium aliadipatigenens]